MSAGINTFYLPACFVSVALEIIINMQICSGYMLILSFWFRGIVFREENGQLFLLRPVRDSLQGQAFFSSHMDVEIICIDYLFGFFALCLSIWLHVAILL